MRDNIESLAKASKELMLREAYYGLLLMSLNKIWSQKKVPTAGVCIKGINYELAINPDFWQTLSPIQKVGILKHELLHIAFFHLTDYNDLQDKKLLNIAMDIEINQYIKRSWLPEDGCFIETYINQGYNLDYKAGTRYYYKELSKIKNEDSELGNALKDLCEGNDNIVTLSDGTEITAPEHEWDSEEINEATQRLIKSQTAHVLDQVADQVKKMRGTVPGEIASIIEKLKQIDPPKFDWKGYMRRFIGKSTRTYTKVSRRKFNKRLPDFPGLKFKKHKHVLAAIDTSASVNTKELKEFLNELHHIKKTGSDVTIIQCDTAISNISKFNPRKDLEIHGRGGTDFQPVIDYYNEKLNEFSCLFYFTDGECSAPENAKGNILWVVSSQGNPWDELPGTTIKLEL
jgi:predicted metal-dependent peptidase